MIGRKLKQNRGRAFEFLPWSDVPDAAAAWQLIKLADRQNGGILIDTWHYFRGTADPIQVRSISADRLFLIQFDDADAVQVDGYMEDTTRRRRLPGQGGFDLIGFIQMLDEMGVNAPVSGLSVEHHRHHLASLQCGAES
jgi:sugar phosphate isomerase/epimerase